ncbi:single-stranded DNA-binding protein [Candidatus Epulonipiscium fishelsonii]|uniref:Single-stranded DNA-binding protein n=1 Tax=Candidatus Epulonipiscium fishelsonii TaxID=77094 RepID=A0ACC8XJ31_9FIRM|nr:single-stranded DNA-binding protein [Epulopiscium sp. SCG-D08WGA-EpuloA1]OON98083.1 MAG: single-stranded DNA-binding protein [Epulopiscium sp. AS2M-Bin002]
MNVEHILENNEVEVIGKVVTGIEYSHKVYGEGFYSFDVEVPRLSDSSDLIPITISERLLPYNAEIEGKIFKITGQFRSYNQYEEGKNRLILTLFALEIEEITEQELSKNHNSLRLKGFVCKPPVYRTTPFGREITDILLAVNRAYHKSDYIPCITWGRNARYAKNLSIGDEIEVLGRIQSRVYQKKLENGETIKRVAYEVSISKMEVVTEGNDLENDSIE